MGQHQMKLHQTNYHIELQIHLLSLLFLRFFHQGHLVQMMQLLNLQQLINNRRMNKLSKQNHTILSQL